MKIAVAGLAFTIAALLSTACTRPAEPQATNAPVAAATLAAPPEAAPAMPASVEALAWMHGNWCGKDDTQSLEETWMLAQAGESIGMSRTLSGGRMISFEFMRIANIEGKVVLLAQPGGDPPVSFARTDGGDDWIRFENKEHDYPQRIEYRKAGEGLHAEIGGPGAGDKEAVIAFEYTRC